MGTHPIFESDFDCLTDVMMEDELEKQEMINNCKSDDRDQRWRRRNSHSTSERIKSRKRSMEKRLKRRKKRGSKSKSKREKSFQAIVTSKNEDARELSGLHSNRMLRKFVWNLQNDQLNYKDCISIYKLKNLRILGTQKAYDIFLIFRLIFLWICDKLQNKINF